MDRVLLKSRDITLPTKVHLVKAMVFPVVMRRCESWTIKKTKCQRTDAFELWCWGRLESPLDCKEIQPVHLKGNQSWIFIGRTYAEAEAQAPILWPPDVKSQFTGKDSNTRKDWGHKRRRWQMMGWLNGITESVDMNLSKPWEIVKDREAWHAIDHGLTKNQTWRRDWTTTATLRLLKNIQNTSNV